MATAATGQAAICGLWVGPDGRVHLRKRAGEGEGWDEEDSFEPFAWCGEAREAGAEGSYREEQLAGPGRLNRLLFFADAGRAMEFLRENRGGYEVIRPFEHQYLLERKERLFGELRLSELRRLQLDIETWCDREGGFSQADEPGDRVLAIGLRMAGKNTLLELEERTDGAERDLLKRFNAALEAMDPDVVEGHNLFNFDLQYLAKRFRRFRVECAWGRFGQKAVFRNSRLRVAERMLDFPRCDLPGRAVIDTYQLVQIYDVTARDMVSYGLKEAARYFGVTREGRDDRTYLGGREIQRTFETDRAVFRAYLEDDLRETAGVADVLLPTYVAQVKSFPVTLQEAALRGTAAKVDTLLLEQYFHARQALPEPPAGIESFEGGYTRSFATGVFRQVLHFDVASLYPSLLLLIGRNPAQDSLRVFMRLLQDLRAYRLRYKELARTAESEALRQEYHARQASFKILINSFYGYLGFGGARFGDGELAAEVTRRGRELLVRLIEKFQEEGCRVLEADTDGIYVEAAAWWDQPEALLARVEAVLPEGIDLEFDGLYRSMLCYKAKNYALWDGERVTVRGSALRSRGIEPFLKGLTADLVDYLLGVKEASPMARWRELWAALETRSLPVAQLARSEYLSMNPEAYRKKMEAGGKPRRAALEAALQLKRPARMGDPVAYYVLPRQKGQTADWQRARPVEAYDPVTAPYDPGHYQKKLEEWLDRYAELLPPGESGRPEQGELLPGMGEGRAT